MNELNHKLYKNLTHLKTLHKGMDSLHRITDPSLYLTGIDFIYNKMIETERANTKSYYKNNLNTLFRNAESLLRTMTPYDEKYLNISISEIKKALNIKRDEYNIN
jgi:hypothetical protein